MVLPMTLGDWLKGGGVHAFVGGGGKTTALVCIAEQADSSILITTTTKLQNPCPIPALLHQGAEAPSERLFDARQPVLWVGGPAEGGSKWQAPPTEALDQYIAANPDRPVFIEADGSKGRPIKAPGPNEPVIPASVDTVVAVIGLSGLGRPVSGDTVHRLGAYQNLTGSREGQIVGPSELVRLLDHPQGLFKGTPDGARRFVLLNQEDREPSPGAAEELAAMLIRDAKRVDSAALADLRHLVHVKVIIKL